MEPPITQADELETVMRQYSDMVYRVAYTQTNCVSLTVMYYTSPHCNIPPMKIGATARRIPNILNMSGISHRKNWLTAPSTQTCGRTTLI